MSQYASDDNAYLLEALDMRMLLRIKQRLYAPAPLNGDERRDLANTLDAIMHRAQEIDCKLPPELMDEEPD
jgi:hypothetical protein